MKGGFKDFWFVLIVESIFWYKDEEVGWINFYFSVEWEWFLSLIFKKIYRI